MRDRPRCPVLSIATLLVLGLSGFEVHERPDLAPFGVVGYEDPEGKQHRQQSGSTHHDLLLGAVLEHPGMN